MGRLRLLDQLHPPHLSGLWDLCLMGRLRLLGQLRLYHLSGQLLLPCRLHLWGLLDQLRLCHL